MIDIVTLLTMLRDFVKDKGLHIIKKYSYGQGLRLAPGIGQ
jgi:hypothetical protein